MAPTLPISAIVDRAAPRISPATQPFGATAPSSTLPLLFTVTGLLALFLGAGWLVVRPEILAMYHYSPGAIAVTHLFVLGWLCSIVMGAMYQLVPVALETKLFSERLAQIQFALHLVGFAGMVWAFQTWNMKLVGHFGMLLAAGIVLFVINLAMTLRRVPKWNVVATSVASALAWIALTVTAGHFLVAGKCSYDAADNGNIFMHGLKSVAKLMQRFDMLGAMHAHAHLGAIGFFFILIVGVSYKLIPMFTLSELQSRRRAAGSVILLNFGLAGSFVTILLRSPWKLAFALLTVLALVIYALELRAILQARKRAALDWGVRTFLTAVGLMFPLSIIAAVLSWPGLPVNACTMQLENVYGFLGLAGVVSFAIVGMLYKIIPFLVWFGTYSRHIGRAQVPSLADMYSARLQVIGYWIFLAGMLATLVAMELSSIVYVRAGCVLLASALAVFGINVFKMLQHMIRPQLKPLPKISASRATL